MSTIHSDQNHTTWFPSFSLPNVRHISNLHDNQEEGRDEGHAGDGTIGCFEEGEWIPLARSLPSRKRGNDSLMMGECDCPDTNLKSQRENPHINLLILPRQTNPCTEPDFTTIDTSINIFLSTSAGLYYTYNALHHNGNYHKTEQIAPKPERNL